MTDRIEQLQAGLAEAGVDALVLRLPENVLLDDRPLGAGGRPRRRRRAARGRRDAAGAGGRGGRGAAPTSPATSAPSPPAAPTGRRRRRASPRTCAPLAARARRRAAAPSATRAASRAVCPPTLDGEAGAVGRADPGADPRGLRHRAPGRPDASSWSRRARSRATRDLDRIRRTNEIAMMALRGLPRGRSSPARTEVEIAAAVESAILIGGHGHQGARVVRAYATVASGPDLAATAGTTSARGRGRSRTARP